MAWIVVFKNDASSDGPTVLMQAPGDGLIAVSQNKSHVVEHGRYLTVLTAVNRADAFIAGADKIVLVRDPDSDKVWLGIGPASWILEKSDAEKIERALKFECDVCKVPGSVVAQCMNCHRLICEGDTTKVRSYSFCSDCEAESDTWEGVDDEIARLIEDLRYGLDDPSQN